MGEITEMMEEGILCQCCGAYLEKSKGEFFQLCKDCEEDALNSTIDYHEKQILKDHPDLLAQANKYKGE